MSAGDPYTSRAPEIEAAIRSVCRRHRLARDRADELAARVRFKLVQDDFAVLRHFKGRSSLRTYLITVVERVLHDWRIGEWGKWRPSAEARRLGQVAIELERLVEREGLTVDEASESMRARGLAESLEELASLMARLRVRPRRRFVDDESVEQLSSPDAGPDAGFAIAEACAVADRAGAALASALDELTPQEQLILRWRFQDGLSVSRIAQLLDQRQRKLYGRLERLLARLKQSLAHQGITAADAVELFSHESVELRPLFNRRTGHGESGPPAGNPRMVPSNLSGAGGDHA